MVGARLGGRAGASLLLSNYFRMGIESFDNLLVLVGP
jgi:hypothetical protein